MKMKLILVYFLRILIALIIPISCFTFQHQSLRVVRTFPSPQSTQLSPQFNDHLLYYAKKVNEDKLCRSKVSYCVNDSHRSIKYMCNQQNDVSESQKELKIQNSLKKIYTRISNYYSDAADYTTGSLGLSFGVRRHVKETLIKSKTTSYEKAFGTRNLKRKALILMSDTGGGHRASAEALRAAFEMEFPGCIDVSIVDIWTEDASWPFNRFVPNYQFMARTPKVWKLFWEYGKYPLTRKFTEIWSSIQCFHRFKRRIELEKPDLVISVHPLCHHIPMKVLKKISPGKKRQRTIPFVTVVTDLGGAHPTWFHPEIDRIFVPSEVIREMALRHQLPAEKIVLHGLPTRPGFWKPIQESKQQLRARLNLRPEVKTCLLVGGGDGVGKLEEIAEELVEALGNGPREQQLIVVCGKNQEVKDRLTNIKAPSSLNFVVLGFVRNMDEWMAAVDVIVTKAGPGTIAEATIRGLPIMLSGHLPGQEEGNVPYVVEGGYGGFSRDPKTIARTVAEWMLDDEKLQRMSTNAKKASRPHATTAIALDIGKMLYAPDPPPTLSEIRAMSQIKEVAAESGQVIAQT